MYMSCERSMFSPFDTLVRVELNIAIAPLCLKTEIVEAVKSHVRCVIACTTVIPNQDLFCCQHTMWLARRCKEAVKIFWAGYSPALCIESGRQCFLWRGNAGAAQFVFNLFNVFSPHKLSNLSLKESGEFVSAKNRRSSSTTKTDKLMKKNTELTRKHGGANCQSLRNLDGNFIKICSFPFFLHNLWGKM